MTCVFDVRMRGKNWFSRSYLTSCSDWANIQYTLERFRLDPSAINCLTEHPSGRFGRLGIWPVHWDAANISGASFTRIFPLGDDLPNSCNKLYEIFLINSSYKFCEEKHINILNLNKMKYCLLLRLCWHETSMFVNLNPFLIENWRSKGFLYKAQFQLLFVANKRQTFSSNLIEFSSRKFP